MHGDMEGADPQEAAGVREGDVLAGKYRIDRVLGVGGMGAVVAAQHIQLDTKVAIKFLLPATVANKEATARFTREAQSAVKITSEHVARVFDVGTLDNGAPYMVMEYLDGGDLSAWLERHGPLPVDLAIEFVLQACVALAEAHSMGIVHRDLKPANLFCLRRADGQNLIKVLDFGISKSTEPGSNVSVTSTATVMGSPLYMSPEQIKSSKNVDARSDIWALGVILYELLTRRLAFDGETFAEIAIKAATQPPPPIKMFRADVPPPVEAAIFKCLRAQRTERHRNVGELAEALVPFGTPRARALLDRIHGIIQGAGLSVSAPTQRPPADLVRVSSPTVSPFGRTTDGAKPRKSAAIGVALVAGVVVLGGGLIVLSKSAPSSVTATAAPAPQPPQQPGQAAVPPPVAQPAAAPPPAPPAPVPAPLRSGSDGDGAGLRGGSRGASRGASALERAPRGGGPRRARAARQAGAPRPARDGRRDPGEQRRHPAGALTRELTGSDSMIRRPATRARLPCVLAILAACAACLLGGAARADNLADEADLQFSLGAEKYKANDFRGALEHFLASNRLVPNRNVVYNIARAYEQLKLSADAYRYLTQALEGETDAAKRARIEEDIARTLPLIAVIRVDSDPPGASVFIDRRDLGARGNTPLVLGLAPGNYHVMADLAGYDSSEASPQDFPAGTQVHIQLTLRQIVGSLHVDGDPAGATVRLDDEQGPVLCTQPCVHDVAPGRPTLFVTAPGHQPTAVSASVVAAAVAQAPVSLTPITRTLLVASEVNGALVSVDGKAQGFTPAALALPLGTHVVSVTRAGYRAYQEQVEITPEGQARVDADMAPIEEVIAVSRSAETVEDAPSSVSIISGQELRAMGYPTVVEALRGTRGIFVGDDSSYPSIGFRGISTLGDYGDHVLVLVDGQPTNDDYVGSSYVGYDGRADIDDIQRIEVVRGPGSALYGTGAFFGVINLVTRDRDAPTHGEVAVSAAGASVGHLRASATLRLSPDAGAWVSVAGAHGGGQDYYFKEFASDPATGGYSRGLDGFDTGTLNGRVWYKSLTLQWLLTSRDKTLPAGEYATVFGDSRTHFVDTRGLVELRFEPVVSTQVQLLSRAHANLYNFDDFLPYTPENGGNASETFRGRWAGLEQRVVYTPIPAMKMTLGGEVQRHFETAQTGSNAQGSYLNRNDPFWVAAGYVVADAEPARAVKISAGARLDYYSNFGSSLNPRAAVILRPYERGVIKIMGGTAFRAPSVYEHFYTGTTQIPGLDLKPERVASGEVELTHRFSSTISGVVAAYGNYITDLIVLGGDGTVASPNQYVNSVNPIETLGAEVEVRREWRNGVMLGASYSLQHSRYLDNEAPPGGVAPLRQVPNSPEHLASLKAAAPIAGSLLGAMTRLSFEGPRFDKYDQAGDPPQNQTPAAVIWDIVLSGEAAKYGVRYNLGIYNAMDYRYAVPISREFVQTSMPQVGRTVLASSQLSF